MVVQIAVLLTCCLGFDLLQTPLPSDTYSALIMASQGEIDSTLLIELQPFYHRPLLVSAGELQNLHNVFPEYAEELPYKREILDRYYPWDSAAVVRFLKDYPVAAQCRSILRFERELHPSIGATSLFIYPQDSLRKHSLRFSLAPSDNISMRGALDMTSSSVRFHRRALHFKWSPFCEVAAGNTVLFNDNGLFYGKFGTSIASRTEERSNVWYGSITSWNGVTATFTSPSLSAGQRGYLKAFYHYRTTEQIRGAILGFDKTSSFNAQLGMTQSSSGIHAQKTPLIVASGKLNLLNYYANVQLGVAPGYWSHIPFMWKNRVTTENHVAEITCTHMPSEFSSSLSRVRQRFKNEMGFSNDEFPVSVTCIQTQLSALSGKKSGFSPGTGIWFSGSSVAHADLYITYKVNAKKASGRLRYSTRFSRVEEKRLYLQYSRLNCDADIALAHTVVFTLRQVLSFNSYEINYFRCSLLPRISLSSGGSILPECAVLINNNFQQELLLRCGFRQQLFRKTFTELRLEKLFVHGGQDEEITVEGNASFLF